MVLVPCGGLDCRRVIRKRVTESRRSTTHSAATRVAQRASIARLQPGSSRSRELGYLRADRGWPRASPRVGIVSLGGGRRVCSRERASD